MKQIGEFLFPESAAEAGGWIPEIMVIALHQKFVLMAKTRIEGAWKCYGIPIPGEGDQVKEAVARWREHGVSIQADIARAAFPLFADIPYAR